MKAYKVYAISDGTVIDHIPNAKALKVIDILGLENEGILTIGIGFSSAKMGKKDIIKIENKYLKKDGQLKEKRKIELPEEYKDIVKCLNPNCVTAVKDVKTRFKIVGRSPLVLRCHFCERIIKSGEVEIL